MWILSSECKIDQAHFTDRISFLYHLTSWGKSALIQKPSKQILPFFNINTIQDGPFRGCSRIEGAKRAQLYLNIPYLQF